MGLEAVGSYGSKVETPLGSYGSATEAEIVGSYGSKGDVTEAVVPTGVGMTGPKRTGELLEAVAFATVEFATRSGAVVRSRGEVVGSYGSKRDVTKALVLRGVGTKAPKKTEELLEAVPFATVEFARPVEFATSPGGVVVGSKRELVGSKENATKPEAVGSYAVGSYGPEDEYDVVSGAKLKFSADEPLDEDKIPVPLEVGAASNREVVMLPFKDVEAARLLRPTTRKDTDVGVVVEQ